MFRRITILTVLAASVALLGWGSQPAASAAPARHAPRTLVAEMRSIGAVILKSGGPDALPKPSMIEICHANAHHGHGLCVAKEGKDSHVQDGQRVVTCEYHCPGKGRYGLVRWRMITKGFVEKDGYHPFRNPQANASLAGSWGGIFKWAGLKQETAYCLTSNPTDARGGQAGVWNCRNFRQFTTWVLWDLTPNESWHYYVMINVYASNADNDSKYYVLSANTEHEGDHIRVLSWGLVHRIYQEWDAYPAVKVR